MTISYDEVMERARSIATVAKKNALVAEQLQRMPKENVDAILASGLMPLLRPRYFGGFEADWLTFIDCVAEVARHCGSTGWCMSFLIQHQFYLAYFPISAQRAVYEQNANPTIATSFAPTGTVHKHSDGFELSGRWIFCSGIDHCDWAIVGGKRETENGPEVCNFLLEPGQFEVERVWNSVGLRGTGSNNLLIKEPVFVPKEFVYSQADALAGRAPGSQFHEGVLYRGPLALNSGFGVMTTMHGLARGAYESFVEYTKQRVALMGDQKALETVEVQSAVGESKAEIDLAHLLMQKMSATAFRDSKVSTSDITTMRRDFIVLRNLLRSAIDRLFALGGARALDQDSSLQRHWRDFHAISHHFTFAAPAFQTAGRRELGLSPAPGDIIVGVD